MDLNTRQQYVHAIKVAILREEKQYKGIDLPSPQKTGTGYQRNTYAIQQANKLVDENTDKLN